MKAKKILTFVFLFLLAAMLLVGCETLADRAKANADSADKDAENQTKMEELIRQKISNLISAEDASLFYDSLDSIFIHKYEISYQVSARVVNKEDLGIAAQILSEATRAVFKELTIQLDTLSVTSYEEDASGIIDGTMVSWRSGDGITGTFLVEEDNTLQLKATTDDINAYFGVTGRDFGDILDVYQGTWRSADNEEKSLVIIGQELTFVSELTISDKVYLTTSTEYFGFDDEGNLIVTNAWKQHINDISLEGQTLTISDPDGDREDSIYTYESDSDFIPYEPDIGMTEDEVWKSTWGRPKDTNTTTTEFGTTEQWVYDRGYIYFRDGKVTRISEN